MYVFSAKLFSMIDLHTHSTASDGTLSPRELVRLAASSQLDAVAITDHDTLDGLEEALEAGKEFGIEVIPGCELSVGTGAHSMHILGLWVMPDSPTLPAILQQIRDARSKRNETIIKKLNALGCTLTLSEVANIASEVIGRPHIAQILKQKGYVHSVEQAFEKYLGKQGQAYVPFEHISVAKALASLKQDRAFSALAHPRQLSLAYTELEKKLKELKKLGLDGLEVYYPEHDARTMDILLYMANKLQLAVSGGSDFHGAIKPKISLGRGKGSLFVPPYVLTELKKYREKQGLWV